MFLIGLSISFNRDGRAVYRAVPEPIRQGYYRTRDIFLTWSCT